MAITKPKCKDGTNGKPLPDVYAVGFVWQLTDGTIVENTAHYYVPELGSTASAWTEFATNLWAAVGDLYQNCMVASATLQYVSVADMLLPRHNHIDVPIPGSPTGRLDGDITDYQSAAVVSWVNFDSFKGGHGNMRVGPVSVTYLANSLVADALRISLVAFATALRTFTNSGGPTAELVVPRVCVPTYSAVTNAKVNRRVGSQNTRLPGRGI